MKVSIITVCLNSEKYIEQTIKSILNQTYEDIEYIIVDGKSIDNTLSIIEKYKPLFGARLKVISEKDNGLYNAMNKGIRNSTGDLIGILNSDDWYEKDAIEQAVRKFEESNESIIYGGLLNIDEKSNKICRIRIPNYRELDLYNVNHPTVFVPKKIYDKYGVFLEKYKISADYELMLRFYKNKINFKYIPKIITNFRDGGISNTRKDLCKKEVFEIQQKNKLTQTMYPINPKINSELRFFWNSLIFKINEKSYNNIYIYGCGTHTERLLDYLPNNIKRNIKGVIDRDVKNKETFYNLNKYDINEVKDYAELIIISSFSFEFEIYKRLLKVVNKEKICRIYGADSVDEANKIIGNVIW